VVTLFFNFNVRQQSSMVVQIDCVALWSTPHQGVQAMRSVGAWVKMHVIKYDLVDVSVKIDLVGVSVKILPMARRLASQTLIGHHHVSVNESFPIHRVMF